MDIKDFEEKLKRIGENLNNELSGLRTNRPSPKMIEDVAVEYMDARMTIKQLGSITVAPPRDLLISAWDQNSLAAIAKGIEAANLGLSVAVQGTIVRATLPAMTGERRELKSKVIVFSEKRGRDGESGRNTSRLPLSRAPPLPLGYAAREPGTATE